MAAEADVGAVVRADNWEPEEADGLPPFKWRLMGTPAPSVAEL